MIAGDLRGLADVGRKHKGSGGWWWWWHGDEWFFCKYGLGNEDSFAATSDDGTLIPHSTQVPS
ncbi:hypothetical protein QQP08_007685 [Theobroma cacao]|nr:hypothetical protein QQP08_007685 [Theobroma cacao]